MKRVRLIYHLINGWNDIFEFPSICDLWRFLKYEKHWLYTDSGVQSLEVLLEEGYEKFSVKSVGLYFDLDNPFIEFDDFCDYIYHLYEDCRHGE